MPENEVNEEEMEYKSKTSVQVQSINDYALGHAIAQRYNLWGPLKGERLLQFFEQLVEVHDRYTEALNDPVMVLKIHRPPTTDEQYEACWSAAVTLFTEHKSLDKVLELTELTFDQLRRSLNRVSQSFSLQAGGHDNSMLSEAGWREAERILLENPTAKRDEFSLAISISAEDGLAIRELYGLKASRGTRIGAPRMPKQAHDRMLELIRAGKQGTEIMVALKREHDVTISRSLVTKTRKRLTDRGLL